MRIFVTGGAGFIGSALVRHLIENTSHEVLNFDKPTMPARCRPSSASQAATAIASSRVTSATPTPSVPRSPSSSPTSSRTWRPKAMSTA
jgi:nucleoside-diphosphate-sugar epimerase